MDGKCVRNPIQSNPNPESESESKDSAELQSTAALTLLLNDGTEYPVTQEYVQEMQTLYPAVDVMQELRTENLDIFGKSRTALTRIVPY